MRPRLASAVPEMDHVRVDAHQTLHVGGQRTFGLTRPIRRPRTITDEQIAEVTVKTLERTPKGGTR
jgi:hypothetical protein